jgi:hypothetical protein
MAKNPDLKIVKPSRSTSTRPPRKLGAFGLSLWDAIMSEYQIDDRGGLEILCQICAALDRAEEMSAQINSDGCVISVRGQTREHPLLKAELACRAFITRNLQRLGLNIEAIKPIGRPSGWSPPMRARDLEE